MDASTTHIVWENHLKSHQNEANGDMPESFPKQNGLLEPSNTTHDGVTNGVLFSEPHPKVQPFVEKISFEKHSLWKSVSRKRKRKRNFSMDTTNFEEVKHSRIELPQSPSSPTWSSLVTVLKYQDGEFVKIHSPSSSYNSPMSLQDMRKAIMDSLESFISQPNIDIESQMEPVSPVNQSPQESPEKVEEIIVETFPEATETKVKVPKEINHSPFPQGLTKKLKSPNKESIKFANRQRELMRMKKEMKNKLKSENSEDGDDSNMAIWGRTVGVSCTMCGKHVQKSYGCFRRDNAPEKLVYLFTPGMNRIKICRRCLPYKKQSPDGEPEKKPSGKKLGGKVAGNNSKKSNNVIKNTVNKALLKAIKKDFPHKKPVSSFTLDAIQRKLTTSNETADPKVIQNSQRKIVLGQSGEGDAMEYIKKLAENIKSNYNKEEEPADKEMSTPLNQQHVSSLIPVTPSSKPIQVSLHTNVNPQEPKTSTQWTPSVVSQGSLSTKPMTPLAAKIRLSVQQKKTGSKLISTPPWTPLIIRQVQSSNLTSALTLGCSSKASTSKAVPKFGLSTSKELQTIPAIVVSSKNAVAGQSPVVFQIQRVKLIKERPGDSKELKTRVKVDDEPTIGKNKSVRMLISSSTNVHPSITCVSCKSTVEESYGYVNQSLSPPKLQHLFTNETEVLRMCQKCLYKESEEKKAEMDEKQNESTAADNQEFPGTSVDQGDIACTSKNNNQELEGTLMDKSSTESLEDIGTLGDTAESVGIKSADDVNIAQSMALNGTVRDNCESQGAQGTSPFFNEKEEENLENDAVRPLESVGGLVASYQDSDCEFMLGESDIIESVVPFVVGSDGNLCPEAGDFLGIGDASLPEDNGVTKDDEELLGCYEAEGTIEDILNAKENEELVKKPDGLKDFKVEFREDKLTLAVIKEDSVEEADKVLTTETPISESQSEGEFSGIETAAITKNSEVDRNEELSQEGICEEAGSSLSTCEEVLTERKSEVEVDEAADRKKEKEEKEEREEKKREEKKREEKKSEEKRIGKEENEGKNFRGEESEMKDNREKFGESERKDIGKERNGDGIAIEERKRKTIGKEGNEGDGIGREESEKKDIGEEESIGKDIRKDETEGKNIEEEESRQESNQESIGKEIIEREGIGRGENERKYIGEEEESIGKDIGKEDREGKNIGEEESKQESIGKEIERNSIGSGDIGEDENIGKDIGKEDREEKNIGEESKQESIGKEIIERKGIGRGESERKDIGEEKEESIGKDIGKEEREENNIIEEESKQESIGKEIIERKGIGSGESERKDIGEEKEESIGKDIGKEEREENNIIEEESKQESIGKEIIERKGIGSGDSERKEIEKEKNEDKSIGKEMNKGKGIEAEESEGNSIGKEESGGKSIGKEESGGKSIGKEESEGNSIGKEESGGKERKVASEKIVNKEEETSDEKKASELKESAKNDGPGTRVKAAATENNAVKENDKRLRQRRTVATSKTSPVKSEKKTVAKWHDKTRGALLKKQKEAEKEAVSETTQGVKRKNEKRPGRGKKAKVEDSVSNASNDETKTSKEESTKDIKGSPSKRMKTRKELN